VLAAGKLYGYFMFHVAPLLSRAWLRAVPALRSIVYRNLEPMQRLRPTGPYVDRGMDARERSLGGASSATAKLRFQLRRLFARVRAVGAVPQVAYWKTHAGWSHRQ